MSGDNPRKIEDVRKEWDELSSSYDGYFNTFEGKLDEYLRWKLIKESHPMDKTARILDAGMWRSRHRVSIVRFTEVLCMIRSDLLYMGRGELHRDQRTILVQTGRMRSAGTGAAKPNVIVREVRGLVSSDGKFVLEKDDKYTINVVKL